MTEQELDQVVERWIAVNETLRQLRDEEKELRLAIVRERFPKTYEGTQKNGKLKVKFGFTRNVEAADLLRLADEFQSQGMDLNALVTYKPSLNLKAYRNLTVDQQHSFDRCLVVKPSLPTLEVVE